MPSTGNPENTLPPAISAAKGGVSSRPGDRAFPIAARRPLRLALPAGPITPSVARHRVRDWLAAWDWPADQLDDIVLAVSEAIENAVEHAYLNQPPGMVEVRGGIEATTGGQRRVIVIVRDHGRWRSAPADHENRRRGIPLMHACMDTVTIGQPDDDRVGTWVVLRSNAVPHRSPCRRADR